MRAAGGAPPAIIVSLLSFVAAAGTAAAQRQDILAAAPETAIYVETSYQGNDGLAGCDWYAAARDLLSDFSRLEPGRDCRIDIRIRGTITREGAALFDDLSGLVETQGWLPATIVLDSRGGDADAAVTMARRIRSSEPFRRVPVETRIGYDERAVCFSACVVLFSAGYVRSLEFDIGGNASLPSRLGIHGPGQFDRSSSRYDSSADNPEFERVRRRLKDWFASVDVDPALVDDMFAVPFDQIRLLGRDELVEYGLYGD